MKKTFIFSALLISVFSCSKENIPTAEEGKQPLVFTAVIDNPTEEESEKTSIDASGKVNWLVDDEITITDASNKKAIYKVSKLDADGKATFVFKSGQSLSTSGTYSAKYGDVNNQWYKGNNGAGCPMTSDVITAPSTQFRFTNDCGVFNISATATDIVKIEVSNSTQRYALNFATKVNMTSGTDYYMLAVPGDASFNNITFVKKDGRKYTKTLSSSYSVSQKHLKKLKFTSSDFNTDSKYNDDYEYIALSGIFTINNNGDKVRFGRGNLQWNGTRYIFAEEQYNTILNSESSSANRDLFTWNESRTNTTKPFTINWRTLKRTELVYILETTARSSNRFICANVHERNGLILFPDNYVVPNGTISSVSNMNNAAPKPGSSNFPTITNENWTILENTGCVFLPGGGYKYNETYCTDNTDRSYNTYGNYWLYNEYSTNEGNSFWWNSSNANTDNYFQYKSSQGTHHLKSYNFSVRLVLTSW